MAAIIQPRSAGLECPIELPEYSIVRSARRRRMSIDVRHDQSVVLRLPMHVSEGEGLRFLEERSRWIARSQTEMRARSHGSLEFRPLHGGVMPWLGRPHRIELLPGIEPEVVEELVRLPAPENSSEELQAHCVKLGLERLIDREGPPWIRARLDELSTLTGLNGSSFVLRDYRSRWGSCSQSGSLTLNRRLMLCRPEVIDYVIIHELCHLVHLNHSPRFWALVERHCPNWKRWRDWLKINTALLEI